MIKGRYEIKIYFDVSGSRSKKELTMGDVFEDSGQFVGKLLQDLEAASPMIDRFIPDPEPAPEEQEVPVDADL